MSPDNICTACGTQFPADGEVPALCPVCADDRQYINPNGQSWTNSEELAAGHAVKIMQLHQKLYTLKITPDFAIGQRAFLVISENGNILWDCIPLLNNDTTNFIKSAGGIKAIVFSHPHYYSNMNQWAEKFNCPIYIHSADEEWISYKSANTHLWYGEKLELWDNISAIHIGGHFPGSCVLRLPLSPEGTILGGDTFYIAPSKKHIAVMHSYPNQILLTKEEFATVYERSKNLKFDTMYCAFERQNLTGNAKAVFDISMQRYLVSYGL